MPTTLQAVSRDSYCQLPPLLSGAKSKETGMEADGVIFVNIPANIVQKNPLSKAGFLTPERVFLTSGTLTETKDLGITIVFRTVGIDTFPIYHFLTRQAGSFPPPPLLRTGVLSTSHLSDGVAANYHPPTGTPEALYSAPQKQRSKHVVRNCFRLRIATQQNLYHHPPPPVTKAPNNDNL